VTYRKGKTVSVASSVIEDSDLFISLPVPKIHMNTGVSLALKNLWGLIPDPKERLRLHPYFPEVIHAIAKSLPKAMAIIDGKFGLTRSGPMDGDVVNTNWLLVSDSLYGADAVGCRLIGIEPSTVWSLKTILQSENVLDATSIELNAALDSFLPPVPFRLERKWTDYPGVLAFRSRFVAWLGYASPFAKPLHQLLYLFRKPFYDYAAARDGVRE
jgi:uncharacterized protein (DUF362 family)